MVRLVYDCFFLLYYVGTCIDARKDISSVFRSVRVATCTKTSPISLGSKHFMNVHVESIEL